MNAINEIKNKRVTRVLSKIKKGNVYNRDYFKDEDSILSTNQLVGLESNYTMDFARCARLGEEQLWKISNLHT